MAKLSFYPYDITYKIIDETPVIHIIGKTSTGEKICLIDRSFEPYFYIVPENTKKIPEIQEKIEKLSVEKNNRTYKVTKTKVENKRYFCDDVEAVKVFVNMPKAVPEIKEIVKKWEFISSVNEYDILFTTRYLVDKKISPLTLCEVEAELIESKLKVPVFELKKITQETEKIFENPKIMSVDIETYSPKGEFSIDSAKNPILMIALHGKNLKKVITWKHFKTKQDYIEFVSGENDLLRRFKEIVEDYKPDFIVGYNSDGFDFPYIYDRALKYKVNIDIGIDSSGIKMSRRGEKKARILGIPHIDVYKFIKRTFATTMETDYFNLDAVAKELIGQGKTDADVGELSTFWDNNPENLEIFCEYNLQDAVITEKIAEKIYPNLIEIVKIVGKMPTDASRMSFSQLIDSYLIKQAPNFKELVPNKPDHKEISKRMLQSYKGAFVFEPKPGLYKNISIFDFRSLYPSIISSHNISPGTLNCSCCKDKEKVPTEQGNYWFCKKNKGFIPEIIEDIIVRRSRIKEIMKKEKNPNLFLVARSESLKLLANSFYGYLGFYGARWYSIESARSTTGYGRHYITGVIEKAKKQGFNPIYSDTDSIFLTFDENKKIEVTNFIENINKDLPGIMELEYEGFYPAGIFVSVKQGNYGAKKKYALLKENGEVKVKGFETVRRNWSDIARETQEKVLEIILKENNVNKALQYVYKVIKELENHEIKTSKLVINTQLTKPIESYESIGPHVAIAKQMEEKGISVSPGSIISYIICQGKGRIRDRAKLVAETSQEDYDSAYYINNQVVPAVESIFNILGHPIKEIVKEKGQSKLEGFFK